MAIVLYIICIIQGCPILRWHLRQLQTFYPSMTYEDIIMSELMKWRVESSLPAVPPSQTMTTLATLTRSRESLSYSDIHQHTLPQPLTALITLYQSVNNHRSANSEFTTFYNQYCVQVINNWNCEHLLKHFVLKR